MENKNNANFTEGNIVKKNATIRSTAKTIYMFYAYE